jgi:pre-mRNA-splicing factor CDC5/CEF1
MHELAVRNQLRSGLASLPKPKDTEWEFEIPDEEQEAAPGEVDGDEDAAERDRREQAIRAAEEELEQRRRTQVMQRDLPRPLVVDLASMLKKADSIQNASEALIARETALLMANDAARYPLAGSQVKATHKSIERFDDDALADARLLILSETKPRPKFEEIQTFFENRAKNPILLGLGCYVDDEAEQEAAMRAAFDVSLHLLSACQQQGDFLFQSANNFAGCSRIHHGFGGARNQVGKEAGSSSRRISETTKDAQGQNQQRIRRPGKGQERPRWFQDIGHIGGRGD